MQARPFTDDEEIDYYLEETIFSHPMGSEPQITILRSLSKRQLVTFAKRLNEHSHYKFVYLCEASLEQAGHSFYELLNANAEVFKKIFPICHLDEITSGLAHTHKSKLTPLQRVQLLKKYINEFSTIKSLKIFLTISRVNLFELANESHDVAKIIMSTDLLAASLTREEWTQLKNKFFGAEVKHETPAAILSINQVSFRQNLENFQDEMNQLLEYLINKILKNIMNIDKYIAFINETKMSDATKRPFAQYKKKYNDLLPTLKMALEEIPTLPLENAVAKSIKLAEFVEQYLNQIQEIPAFTETKSTGTTTKTILIQTLSDTIENSPLGKDVFPSKIDALNKIKTIDEQYIVPTLKIILEIRNYLSAAMWSLPETYANEENTPNLPSFDTASFFTQRKVFKTPDVKPVEKTPIPEKIHYVWVGGYLKIPYFRNIMTMMFHAPGKEFNLWTDNPDVLRKACRESYGEFAHKIRIRSISEIIEKMKAHCTDRAFSALMNILAREGIGLENLAAKSDILRLLILYFEGGLYLDADISYAKRKSSEYIIKLIIVELLKNKIFEILYSTNDPALRTLLENIFNPLWIFIHAMSMGGYKLNNLNEILNIRHKQFKDRIHELESELIKYPHIQAEVEKFDNIIEQLQKETDLFAKDPFTSESKEVYILPPAMRKESYFPTFQLLTGFKHIDRNNCVMASTPFHPLLHEMLALSLTNLRRLDRKEYLPNEADELDMDKKRSDYASRRYLTINHFAGPGTVSKAVRSYREKHDLNPAHKFVFKVKGYASKNEDKLFGKDGIIKIQCDNTWLVKNNRKSFECDDINTPQMKLLKLTPPRVRVVDVLEACGSKTDGIGLQEGLQCRAGGKV